MKMNFPLTLGRRSVQVCAGRTTLPVTVIFEAVPGEAGGHFRGVCRFILAFSPLSDVPDIEALLHPLPKIATRLSPGTVSITRQASSQPHTTSAAVCAGRKRARY